MPYNETGVFTQVPEVNNRNRLRYEVLRAALADMTPIEQASIQRQARKLMQIKGVGEDVALEILAALGRFMVKKHGN